MRQKLTKTFKIQELFLALKQRGDDGHWTSGRKIYKYVNLKKCSQEDGEKMATLSMHGAYELKLEKIDQVVTDTSLGNYALGYTSGDVFYVRYVGRSDTDVNNRLKSWVGKNKRYVHFMFSYAKSLGEAFGKECQNYHDFGGKEKLDNENHPQCPEGTNWKCPVCGV